MLILWIKEDLCVEPSNNNKNLTKRVALKNISLNLEKPNAMPSTQNHSSSQ